MPGTLLKRPGFDGGLPQPRPLTWSPPNTAGWTIQNVTDGGAYFFDTATDVVLVMPNFAITGFPFDPSHEALVTVKNVRDVVVIGGRIDVPAVAKTRLTAPYTDGAGTVNVGSTAGFPTQGKLNFGGYQLDYTGKTGTTFTGVTRAAFSYTNAVAFPVPADTPVWIGEQNRGGLAFNNCRNVFIEGIYGTGLMVDFIRYTSSLAGSTLTVQNCRVENCVHLDGGTVFDGHPDCIQAAAGPTTLRMDRFTGYSSGRGLINKADAGNPSTSVVARDVNFVGDERFPRTEGVMWDNAYSQTTAFDCMNCWASAPPDRPIVATTASDPSKLDRQIRRGRPERDFVLPSDCGLGYVSPGYLS